MTGRHRRRSDIITAVMWVIRMAAVVFSVMACMIVSLYLTR